MADETQVVNEDLSAVPAEDVEVQKQHTPTDPITIGSKEFNDELLKEMGECKQPWRTSSALAKKFNVDAVELDKFLRSQAIVCSRPSKEEGVFLYALVKRLDKEEKKIDPKVEQAVRPLVTEEDRYALASLHSAYVLLEGALQKYALRIHERNSEAFTSLVQGKDKVEAGIVLLATRLKADVNKLPKV